MTHIIQVSIPHSYKSYFDYQWDGAPPPIGVRVTVPLRRQTRIGVIVGISTHSSHKTLKSIIRVLDDVPVITPDILQLCQWISQYYHSPLSEVLALALPKKYRLGQPQQLATQVLYATQKAPPEKLTPKTLALWQFIQQNPWSSWQSIRQAGFSKLMLQRLEPSLHQQESFQLPPRSGSDNPELPLALHPEQKIAVDTLLASQQQFGCFLLQGVTGSGKTEVYLQILTPILAAGKQALILVPEIGLTPQLMARFQSRFTEPLVVLHSHLNDTERQNAWQLAKEGIARIVLGTRSAVFTPMPDLGIIIIDEEHDLSFKQMDTVRYSARDSAIIRAKNKNIPILLGSATPSLETLANVQQQKYQRLLLTQRAINTTPLHYTLVDLRLHKTKEGIADLTCERIKQHLDAGQQVLLFINRRGFAPVLLCGNCHHILDCPACDSHQTWHESIQKRICHHCGAQHAKPQSCPKCQQSAWVAIGSGTQRIDQYLQEKFPNTALVRIDKDTVSRKAAFDTELQRIERGEVQLLVGTQMLAKGHHFPKLSLVVILDTDNGLFHHDFRALERLGQLLTQVAGRAGRAETAGEIVLQTYYPQHPLLQCLIQKGYDALAQELLLTRQKAQLPPFHYLALLRAEHKSENVVSSFFKHLCAQTLPMQMIGPAPAPLARKAKQHRMQLLLKSHCRAQLHQGLEALYQLLETFPLAKKVRWSVDVDPLDFS
ncbi:MAG: primosomal protein N' [Legionellaceae bacterium]|nr:primosomal protein N' [Legionellaceae bacterium]